MKYDYNGFIVLERRYSDLYVKTNYLVPLEVVQNHIYEYDIKSANVSVMRNSGLFRDEDLDRIAKMDKESRNVTVGKMIRADKEVGKVIKEGIIEAKKQLFEVNEIKDEDLLAIKNDAVFVIGRKLKDTHFGSVEFRVKGDYCLYLNLSGIELYYDKKNDSITLKGIDDDVIGEPDHQKGMINFFRRVCHDIVYGRYQSLRTYLISFGKDYKNFSLPVQYYRELNYFNIYRTQIHISGFEYNLYTAEDEDREDLNITYNYKKFVLPVIRNYI